MISESGKEWRRNVQFLVVDAPTVYCVCLLDVVSIYIVVAQNSACYNLHTLIS